MAQPIANTVKPTNNLQGLLGLLPAPKATVQTSTPALIPSQTAPKPAATTSLFSGTSKTAPTSAFSNQPNFQSLDGTKSYVPPPVTGPTYTASGVVPSAFTTLGQQPTQQNTGTQGYATSGIQSPAPTGTSTVAGAPQTFTTPSGAVVNADGSTVSTPSSSTKGLFSSVVGSLAGVGPANAAIGANAQKIASDAGTAIANVGSQGQRFIAGQRTTGTTPVAEGNAAVTAQTTAAEQAAIAAGANVALQGNQQALTAQGQTQTALGTAGGLAQPSPAAYGQTTFDPVTGTYSGGANGGLPPDVMQQYAQMAATGQYSAIPSFITSNPVLSAQLNVAAKALNPNYSPLQSQGAGSVLQGIPQLQSANTAADGIKNTINTYLSQNPTLNPSNLAVGNTLQQWIQGKQLTDPKYQTLFNYLNEYTNTLAPILGVGGDPTNLKTQIAASFINAAASGQSISQVLDAMSALSTNKIQDLQSGAVGGTTGVPNTSTGGGTQGTVQTNYGTINPNL